MAQGNVASKHHDRCRRSIEHPFPLGEQAGRNSPRHLCAARCACDSSHRLLRLSRKIRCQEQQHAVGAAFGSSLQRQPQRFFRQRRLGLVAGQQGTGNAHCGGPLAGSAVFSG
jgi:hypothetical protein